MNMNPGRFTTYKSLSPVLRTQTTCNFMITKAVFSYGTDSQKVKNRFLYDQYHSGNIAVS